MAGFEIIRPKRPIADKAKMVAALSKAMRDTISEGQRWMAEYPAQTLRKTGYRRTGTLKRSWSSTLRTSNVSIEGTVGSNANIAPYNRPVQGKPQARPFRGTGWRNIAQLKEKMSKDLRTKAEQAIRMAVK